MKRSLIIFSATAVSLFMATIPFITSAVLISFDNPLTAGDARELIQSVVNQLRPFAITIASIAILYIGFRMAVAAGSGNESELTKWKKLLVYALIGAAIIAGAKTFFDAIKLFAEQIA